MSGGFLPPKSMSARRSTANTTNAAHGIQLPGAPGTDGYSDGDDLGLDPETDPNDPKIKKLSARKLAGQASDLVTRVSTTLQNTFPENVYNSVGDDLSRLSALLKNLDGRRITERLNDPSAGGKAKRPVRAKKAAKKATKKATKRAAKKRR